MMNFIELLGRILYAAIFLMAAPGHFTAPKIQYAASQNVPYPEIAVPLSGVIALLGSLSIVFGYKTKFGAWLIVLFLVPVTFLIHDFWLIKDPMEAAMQKIQFMKNLSMLGAAFLIAYFGPGWFSLDRRDKS